MAASHPGVPGEVRVAIAVRSRELAVHHGHLPDVRVGRVQLGAGTVSAVHALSSIRQSWSMASPLGRSQLRGAVRQLSVCVRWTYRSNGRPRTEASWAGSAWTTTTPSTSRARRVTHRFASSGRIHRSARTSVTSEIRVRKLRRRLGRSGSMERIRIPNPKPRRREHDACQADLRVEFDRLEAPLQPYPPARRAAPRSRPRSRTQPRKGGVDMKARLLKIVSTLAPVAVLVAAVAGSKFP